MISAVEKLAKSRFIEASIAESINARTAAFPTLRDLGPPDVAHLLKTNPANRKETGSYHYVLGVDSSSSASLAAYLTSLTYALSPDKLKIIRGMYCCWNAFSRIDLRVEVRIPGGVEAWAVDERGEKKAATEQLWQETYLSAVLRALSYPDDPAFNIQGCRKLNPIPNLDAEQKCFSLAEKFFFRGPQLGSTPECQVPTLVSNHLVFGLQKYIRTFRRFDMGINLFEKLAAREPEVSALLASTYLEMDEEVRAVRIMNSTLLTDPMDAPSLLLQSNFLSAKSQYNLALEIAKRAVNASPSEFLTWKRLAECHIALGNFQEALLCLNSCPMFTYADPPLPRMPPPARAYLPIPTYAVLDDVEIDMHDQVDPTLVKLPAPALRGTFKEAYSLLTKIVAAIGWDGLLRTRSTVFVMEEEYRSEKTKARAHGVSDSPAADNHHEADHRASTEGIRSHNEKTSSRDNLPTTNGESEETSGAPAKQTEDTAESVESPRERGETINKPDPLVPAADIKASAPDDAESKTRPFHDKRLCERWLDNLFMVLYEDLRVYTIWRAELEQFSSHEVPYKKSCLEHEILGELALRLQHPAEAIESFRNALQIRFSSKSWRAIVSNIQKAATDEVLEGIIRLIVSSHRWYEEFSPSLLDVLCRLIVEEGPVKIKSRIAATKFNPEVVSLVESWIGLLEAFGVDSA